MDALDAIAAQGRQAAKLVRPISDCPAKLDEHERRAWLAGWRHGHEWLLANRAAYEAGVRAYGHGAPARRVSVEYRAGPIADRRRRRARSSG